MVWGPFITSYLVHFVKWCQLLTEWISWLDPEIENGLYVIAPNRWSHDYHGKLHRGRHGLGGEFTWQLSSLAESFNNWSQLAFYRNMVRYVIEKNQVSLTGMDVGSPRGCRQCPAEAIERAWIVILLKWTARHPVSIDPDVISLGGSISQNPDFISKCKAVDIFVERYEEYTISSVTACTLSEADANLRCSYNWLQEAAVSFMT